SQTANSAVGATHYTERVLDADQNAVHATIRRYVAGALEKKLGETAQHIDLRSAVSRIVIRRAGGETTAFSPDGPLTAPELDLVRAETFTPALSGLLPEAAVERGDRVEATAEAAAALPGVDP